VAEDREFQGTFAHSSGRWFERTPLSGQRRVASELAVKLGIHISPRTIRAYWPEELEPSHRGDSRRWMTFVRNHAKAMVACDFAAAVTLRFRFSTYGHGPGHAQTSARKHNPSSQLRPDAATTPGSMSLGPGIPDPVPGVAIPPKMHGH
jgi:hypothetical protein